MPANVILAACSVWGILDVRVGALTRPAFAHGPRLLHCEIDCYYLIF